MHKQVEEQILVSLSVIPFSLKSKKLKKNILIDKTFSALYEKEINKMQY